MEDNANKRFRLWKLLLYKDTTSYDYIDVMCNLKAFKNWAYIEHEPEQDEKKYHTHFILRLDNACTQQALSKKTGIPENFIQNGRNERALCRYLIHADDDDKKSYDMHDVKTSRSYERFFKKQFDDFETETEIITNIYNTIDSLTNASKDMKKVMPLLLQYINTNCYDTIYKRYRFEFQNYLTLSL